VTVDLSGLTDEALAVRARTEPRAAFEILFERYRTPLHSFLLRQGAADSRVDDLFQMAFLKAYRAISQFREDARFKTWLYTIATNVLLDDRRSQRRATTELPDSIPAAPAPDRLEKEETLDRIKEALSQVTPGHRLLFTLVRFQGLPIAEAAAVIGMTPRAAKVTLFRVSKKVGELLSPVKENTP
jgi:RNA polymerase sigma-70 factor (ECF subfamily)